MVIVRDADVYDFVCRKRKVPKLRWCCKKSSKLALRWVGTRVVPGSIPRSKLLEPKESKYSQSDNLFYNVSSDDDDEDVPNREFVFDSQEVF